MTPERIEELARDTLWWNGGDDLGTEIADAIRTAVREALDAAARECDPVIRRGNSDPDVTGHHYASAAAACSVRIRALRDSLTAPPDTPAPPPDGTPPTSARGRT